MKNYKLSNFHLIEKEKQLLLKHLMIKLFYTVKVLILLSKKD